MASYTAELSGDVAVFVADEVEVEVGGDLNGDGDRGDSVVHVHDLLSGKTISTGLAVVESSFPSPRVRRISI